MRIIRFAAALLFAIMLFANFGIHHAHGMKTALTGPGDPIPHCPSGKVCLN